MQLHIAVRSSCLLFFAFLLRFQLQVLASEYIPPPDQAALAGAFDGLRTHPDCSVRLRKQCQEFKDRFDGIVALPQDARYAEQQQSYWASDQADLEPCCRLSPTSSTQVAVVVRALYETRTHFAVKSGGHSANVEASNVGNGVTLDLSSLSHIALSADKTVLDVEAGARWRDVYEVTDRENLFVNGARAGSVGVSGFLLGGGISVLANQHGWSCDSMRSVEVVTANGTLVEANITHHSDLLRGLKGTGSILGIMTKFRLDTYRNDALQVAFLSYSLDQVEAVLQALQDLNTAAENDTKASADLSVGFDLESNQTVVVLMLTRFGEIHSSESLRPFFDVPSLSSSVRNTTAGELALLVDMNNPAGFRQQRSTLTMQNDAPLVRDIVRKFAHLSSHQLYSADPNYRAGLLVQPLTLPHLQHSARSGIGNMLGLEASAEPLVLLSIEVRWSQTSLDAVYHKLMHDILETSEQLARQSGQMHNFRYPNYASSEQDVFAVIDHSGQLGEFRELRDRYDPGHFLTNYLSRPFNIPAD